MQNHFPFWKNLLIVIVCLIGLFYASPNLYGDDPSVQVSPVKEIEFADEQLKQVDEALSKASIKTKAIELEKNKALVRFENTDEQLQAADILRDNMGDGYKRWEQTLCISVWIYGVGYIFCWRWTWVRP